ncbi:MAG: glucose 1-dehydrogenase [Paracoccaceae bacterium]
MAEGRYMRQVVLISGAASGFGARAARDFAAQGARLVLSDLDGARLSTVAEGLRDAGREVLAEVVDVSDPEQMQAHHAHALEQFGRLDVAVNNAGRAHALTPLPDLPLATFEETMAVNARGVFLAMKNQIPIMAGQGSGVILNVASAAGLVGAGHLSAYAAAKHAVIGLTRSAADETARKGIRINALCPSFADTPLYDEIAGAVAGRANFTRAEADARITGRIPMGRVAQPQEVVQAMLWLCSPENTFMTGQAIALDGGLTAI